MLKKSLSSKNLQKYRNPTRSESAKTRSFNKKQQVLTAEKCLQQLFICKFDAIRCSVLSREYSTPFIKRNIE